MSDTADLPTRARAWFEAQPHRHPAGRTPEWDMQPESVRRISALHAARIAWNGRLEALTDESRKDMPQTVLRAAADALWASDRSTRARTCASALWAAASELDLDVEGFALLRDETLRLARLLPLDSDLASCIDADTLTDLNAVLISLRSVVSTLGTKTAAIPFALAADLVLATWSFSHGRRRMPLPDEDGRDDAVEVIESMAFLMSTAWKDEA